MHSHRSQDLTRNNPRRSEADAIPAALRHFFHWPAIFNKWSSGPSSPACSTSGTPDLTKEYVPSRRRNPETPEAQQGLNAGLPTPATDRKTAPRAFELDDTIEEEDSNESSNNFQDPVDDDAMSENAGCPSGRDSASEETRMRLEIARLQHEVERMKASRGEPSAAEEISADLELPSTEGKNPVVLTGSANYPMWKEEIILAARQSETNDMLEEKQESPDEDASQGPFHYTQRVPVICAYALWTTVEDNFAERPAVRRARLFQELIEMTAKSKGSDRAFIELLIAIRTEDIRIGYTVEDLMFFDRLLTGVRDGLHS
ncbi:hypothetical protein ACJ73_03782 [Blastomyces percursus]|uniref:Uncharacterized protein n=1 Tax=Blastomyces percursus TaxID=1658174 RepID=A0A1J9R8M1_9EURO|nr:hypothetical protein ACJ73_03782 [Blastomyces percursus]